MRLLWPGVPSRSGLPSVEISLWEITRVDQGFEVCLHRSSRQSCAVSVLRDRVCPPIVLGTATCLMLESLVGESLGMV